MIGKIIKEIPPSKNNPRNSEGAFIELKDGTIIFAYSKFIGKDGKDDASACIAFLYSYDNGQTFVNEKIMFEKDEINAKNIMSVSFLRLKDSIAIFYAIRYGFHDIRLHMRKSYDEGKTFSKLKSCIMYQGYHVTNNDRVVLLSNGRLIVPTAFHRCVTNNPDDWKSFSGKGVARFFISDDEGETFRESAGFGSINSKLSNSGLQEPGIIELDQGHLLCYCRTDLGSQYLSHSYDYGETWSEFLPSKFFSPTAPMSMKRLDNSIYAIYNPIPITPIFNEGISWGRTPLIGAISEDNGKNFNKFFVIEDDKKRGFCYTAMYYTKNKLLLAYCSGSEKDGGCLNRLTIKSIDIDKINSNLSKSNLNIEVY